MDFYDRKNDPDDLNKLQFNENSKYNHVNLRNKLIYEFLKV
ncbi:hypothetical protein LCGC14_0710820 [marine sediment metagenome]|uniref:N-sulphoglucosamine sulphohydrolase C-terminal domain-containing protein n=1 Tax=marine sediment metagenome TaxID=412755 RepID=A0A0F9T0L9_9ZZZZ|nr:MAG: hypothetical protein Lokiarch_35020 [Candidatus Lokiarchaeum sp. GC14_75]